MLFCPFQNSVWKCRLLSQGLTSIEKKKKKSHKIIYKTANDIKHVCILLFAPIRIDFECLSQRTSSGKYADEINAITPHSTFRKMLPLFPKMSQMFLTLPHRGEHLTLTQCSLGLCLICIGALFSISRRRPLIGVPYCFPTLKKQNQALTTEQLQTCACLRWWSKAQTVSFETLSEGLRIV